MKAFIVFFLIAAALGCSPAKNGKIKEINQYTGSEPPKHSYENKLGTQQRLEDNSSRIPYEFRKK